MGASPLGALRVADSQRASAGINNGAKEAFACRSTPSTPNAKDDDSAVRCPLCGADGGAEQPRPTGATCVKAWRSVPGPL